MKGDPIVGFNVKAVKNQKKEQFIKDHSHLDPKWLEKKYDEIVGKQAKEEK